MQGSFETFVMGVITHWVVLAFKCAVFCPCFHLCNKVTLIFMVNINHLGTLKFQSAGFVCCFSPWVFFIYLKFACCAESST